MLFVVGLLLCPNNHFLRLCITSVYGRGGVGDGESGIGAESMGGHGVLSMVGTRDAEDVISILHLTKFFNVFNRIS